MEKRLFIFLALTMLVLILSQKLFAPQRQVPTKEDIIETEALTEETQPEAEVVPQERVVTVEGKDIVIDTDLYRLVLTTSGARIKSCRLKKYEEMDLKKNVLGKNLSRIEQALVKEQDAGKRNSLIRERDRLRFLIERESVPGEGVELVPFVGDIPLLGYLFQSRKETIDRSEFVLYIVPYAELPDTKDLNVSLRMERLYRRFY